MYLSHSTIHTPHITTAANYKDLAVCNMNIKLVKKIQQKKESRFIEENSVMSTITYLFAIAVRNYILGNSSPTIYHKCSIIHIPKGVKLLYELVKRASND